MKDSKALQLARLATRNSWEEEFVANVGKRLEQGFGLTRDQALMLHELAARPSAKRKDPDRPKWGPDGLPLNDAAHEITYGQGRPEPETHECPRDGCDWRGALADWWQHRYDVHGEAFPHWMEGRESDA